MSEPEAKEEPQTEFGKIAKWATGIVLAVSTFLTAWSSVQDQVGKLASRDSKQAAVADTCSAEVEKLNAQVNRLWRFVDVPHPRETAWTGPEYLPRLKRMEE